MIWRCHDILCFLFYFVSRTNVKKATRLKRPKSLFMHVFSKVPFWNFLIKLCSKFFRNNFKTLWQRHLKRYITVEDFTDTIWTNFFLEKISLKENCEGAWKIIIHTIIRACSSKNIAPRHFTYYCMLVFLSNKPSL